MRYRKLLATAMLAVMVLSGCNTDKPAETSSVTEEVTATETAEITTTAANTTTAITTTTAQTIEDDYEKDFGSYEYISEYNFANEIQPLLDKNGLGDYRFRWDYKKYAKTEDYAVLKMRNTDEKEYGGDYLFVSDNGVYLIESDSTTMLTSSFYIHDDRFCVIRISEPRTDGSYGSYKYCEYSIKSGEKILEYSEKYSRSEDTGKYDGNCDVTRLNCEFENFDEVREYRYEKSGGVMYSFGVTDPYPKEYAHGFFDNDERLHIIERYDYKHDIKPVMDTGGIDYSLTWGDETWQIPEYTGFAQIGEYTLITQDNDHNWMFGNTGHILFKDGLRYDVFPDRSDMFVVDPYYFISDGRLCILNEYLKNGLTHEGYWEYDIASGEQMMYFFDGYDLRGAPMDLPIRVNCDFEDFERVYEYAVEKSGGTMYQLQIYVEDSNIILETEGMRVYDNEDGSYNVTFRGNHDVIYMTIQPPVIDIFTYTDNGKEFIIATHHAMGNALPADIIANINGNYVDYQIFSDASETNVDKMLFWNGYTVCKRGNGVSIGIHNVIPCYWNEKVGIFRKYELHEITLDELRELDTGNIVPDADKAISIYKRENGLVHVNYLEVYEDSISNPPQNASKTYVITDDGLRKYDFDKDQKYGVFIERLTVNE